MDLEKIKNYANEIKVEIDVKYGEEPGKLTLNKFNTLELSKFLTFDKLQKMDKGDLVFSEFITLFKNKVIKENPSMSKHEDSVETFIIENFQSISEQIDSFLPKDMVAKAKAKEEMKKGL